MYRWIKRVCKKHYVPNEKEKNWKKQKKLLVKF